MASDDDRTWHPEPISRRRQTQGIGLTLLGYVLCQFVPAGTLAWFRGWLFFVMVESMPLRCVTTQLSLRSVSSPYSLAAPSSPLQNHRLLSET
jgi:hypothetical protein